MPKFSNLARRVCGQMFHMRSKEHGQRLRDYNFLSTFMTTEYRKDIAVSTYLTAGIGGGGCEVDDVVHSTPSSWRRIFSASLAMALALAGGSSLTTLRAKGPVSISSGCNEHSVDYSEAGITQPFIDKYALLSKTYRAGRPIIRKVLKT